MGSLCSGNFSSWIMSSQAQVRRVTLSQRYLSTTVVRYDDSTKAAKNTTGKPFDPMTFQLPGSRHSSGSAQPHRSYGIRTLASPTIYQSKYTNLLSLRDSAGGHSNYSKANENNFNPHIKPLAVLLGFIGVFKRKTSDDGLEVAEEKEGQQQTRLSDAEKMKKMKPIDLKIAKGVLSMCDQDYLRANVLFHEALHIAQDEYDEKQETMILNLIAANYFESGDFENAEKLFIDLMKRMIANEVAPTAPPILELSLKLASIYSRNAETHEKALKGFKFVINSLLYNLEDVLKNLDGLDIQELSEEKRDQLALLGWSYDWFAKHLLAVNDYNGAADMLQRALQISSKVLGALHDQTLILLNDVGTTLAMNNDPEEGMSFITRAVEGAITSQSSELASFYVNLGLVNLKLKKLQEAKRYCEYSMELAGKNREHYNSHEVIELSRSCLNEVERLLEAETPNRQ